VIRRRQTHHARAAAASAAAPARPAAANQGIQFSADEPPGISVVVLSDGGTEQKQQPADYELPSYDDAVNMNRC